MKAFENTFGNTLGLIAAILVCVGLVAGGYFLGVHFGWWQNIFQTNQPPVVVNYPAFGPPPQITLSPGPGSNSVPTVMAVIPKPNLGNVNGLSLAISQYIVKDTFDNRGVAKVRTIGVGRYCQSLTYNDQTIPWSEMGAFSVVESDLYGGVRQSDLQNLDNIKIIPVDEKTITKADGTKEIVNSVRIEITIHMGLSSEPGRTPGNTFKYTVNDAGQIHYWITDPLSKWTTGMSVLNELRDHVDNMSLEAAEWNGLAPITSTGYRTTWKLDQLYEQVVLSLNTPTSPEELAADPENHHAYDNLRKDMENYAKENGFQELTRLDVNVIKPTTLPEYIYLEDGSPVVPDGTDDKFKGSTCSMVPDRTWLTQLPDSWVQSLNPNVYRMLFQELP